ncbi:hypothetical protein CK203_086148 [Vitis vinifera]|uniref:Uncharacterized protein n=1 Tax=Vitis vinifera TaxID=29760 RepID=A0A438CTC0_VITVI|nr:hypothetical protein CK203_086148 [Vitis vinifera]
MMVEEATSWTFIATRKEIPAVLESPKEAACLLMDNGGRRAFPMVESYARSGEQRKARVCEENLGSRPDIVVSGLEDCVKEVWLWWEFTPWLLTVVSKERCKIPKMGMMVKILHAWVESGKGRRESCRRGFYTCHLRRQASLHMQTMVIVFSRCGGCSVDQATVGIVPSVCLDEAIGPFRF